MHHGGVSTQIAVRLPDSLVEARDELVVRGEAQSRAQVVSAVERELRHRLALQDAEILRELGTADDLDELVEWTRHNHVSGQ